ncbi:MAG: AI-2E family transporter [Erysipelotrichaceae bacterium]|nr:AI-2E family transporter [Erysipelotrichaceae bacterium]
MRFEYNEDMKKKIITYASVATIAIVIFFGIYNFSALKGFIAQLFDLATPFIIGFSIAFLLNQPMVFIEEKLLGKVRIKPRLKRTIAALSALILALFLVSAFLALLIPQVFDSLSSLVKSAPSHIEELQAYVTNFIEANNIDIAQITDFVGDIDIFGKLTAFFSNALPAMVRFSLRFTTFLFDIVLGIMSAIYIMLDKERLKRSVKVANYAIFPKDIADYLVGLVIDAKHIFNNFIIGKAIDSFIIGVLCYIGLVIINIPYALLLAVIIGITNMIPIFGPFIGAVPGVLILMIINPVLAIYFVIFIFVLQQFDGNILGPLILGDKLGLSSLWILVSVTIGGSLFGIIGMFIGVPIFTVIYTGLRRYFYYRLDKKKLVVEIEESTLSINDKNKDKA